MKRLLVLFLLIASSLCAQVSGPTIMQIGGDAPALSVMGVAKKATTLPPERAIPNCVLALYCEKYTNPGALQTATWKNSSSGGNDFTQSTDAYKPYQNYILASNSVGLTFKGSGASMSAAVPILSGPPYTSVIIEQENASAGAVFYIGAEFQHVNQPTNHCVYSYQQTSDPALSACFSFGRSDFMSLTSFMSNTPTLTDFFNPHSQIIRSSSLSNYEARFNNNQVWQSSAAYTNGFISPYVAPMRMAPYYSAVYYTIYAAYIFNRAITNAEISTILSYVNTKYKLGMNL